MSKMKSEISQELSAFSLRALIVEDEIEYQLHLDSVLKTLSKDSHAYIFSSGNDCISFVQDFRGKLQLALVDLGLPDTNGEEIIAALRQKRPEIKILVLTTILCQTRFGRAIKAGADGYILKYDPLLSLSGSIGEILKGNSPVSSSIAGNLLEFFRKESRSVFSLAPSLSRRERELLECLNAGLSYTEAAFKMGLSTSTVHSYSRSLFKKLKSRSQLQALNVARKYGFLSS